MTQIFQAKGKVLGYLWGGGLATMDSITFEAPTLAELKEQINADLENNKLTGTGDFESQIGAYMTIETIREVEIDGRVFCNVETETHSFGDFNEDQKALLSDYYYYGY